MKIPAEGMTRDQVFSHLASFSSNDLEWRTGRTWAYVYDAGDDVNALVKEAFGAYLSENALDPTAFPSMMLLENQVVSMTAELMGGDEYTVGSFTSGGTESIFMALKSARDFARTERGIAEPEIILPVTAHASFQKACHYLDMNAVVVPVGDDFRADPQAIVDAITDDTIMIVGSACSYAHGVVDPISALGEIALEHDLLLHVDACIGGIVLAFYRKNGVEVPAFDLSVPGVTSLSVDLHKYGFAAKGASIVVYNRPELRRHQIYACANWSGYTVVNTTVQSTKGGGPVAAAWAVMHYMGQDRYTELFAGIHESTQRLVDGLEALDGVRLLARPDTNLIAFTTTDVDVFHLADEMKARGWYIQPQLGFGDSPANIHLSVNPKASKWIDELLADLADAIDAAAELPSGHLAPQVRDLVTEHDGEFSAGLFMQLMALAGIQGLDLPERMASINEILNTLSPNLRAELLVEFINMLYIHRDV